MNSFGVWAVAVAGVLVGGLVVLSVVSAMGTEGDGTNTTTTVPEQTTATTGEDGFAVTDTTVAGWLDPSGGYDVASDGGTGGISVTDHTTPLSQPEPEVDSPAQNDQTTTTITTAPQLSVTTTTSDRSVPRRVHHPTWDHRLPSTWEGLPATECAKTFRIEMVYDDPSWDYDSRDEGLYNSEEAFLIDAALRDPTFEVEPGRSGFDKMVATITKLKPGLLQVNPDLLSYDYYDRVHSADLQALANLGVSSVQDIREIGEAAINVRWYAWRTKFYIMEFGDPNHPVCAPMIEAADTILTPYTTTTTTATAS